MTLVIKSKQETKGINSVRTIDATRAAGTRQHKPDQVTLVIKSKQETKGINSVRTIDATRAAGTRQQRRASPA